LREIVSRSPREPALGGAVVEREHADRSTSTDGASSDDVRVMTRLRVALPEVLMEHEHDTRPIGGQEQRKFSLGADRRAGPFRSRG